MEAGGHSGVAGFGSFKSAAPVAVLGARGMLGADVCRALACRGVPFFEYDLPEWDIRRESDVRAAVRSAGAVINCAAYTDVEGAEVDPDAAFAVNAHAVERLAAYAAEQGRGLIHFSTDFVFDGRQDRPYREEDEPNPINVYGRSKHAGEKAVLAAGGRAVIVRIQWTYGRAGRNFVSKILDRARAGGDLHVVDDQRGAPTWTRDVADATVALLFAFPELDVRVLHYAARGCASRFETAWFIVRAAGLSVRMTPCSSADFPSAAARPANSCFDCSRFDALFPGMRRPWQTALTQFLSEEGLGSGHAAEVDP